MKKYENKIDIKDKIFKNITEAATELGLEKYVLRFWEKEFSQLNPRRYNGKRYYSPDDIKIIKKIKDLLHDKKFTIKGAKEKLSISSEEDSFYKNLQNINNNLKDIFISIKNNI